MVKYVDGKDLLREEKERIIYISNVSYVNDFKDLNIDDLDRLPDFDSTFIIGDDWYLNYKIEDDTVFLDRFYSIGKTNNKRIIEISKVIKELMIKFKDYYLVGSLRHDTTFKLYSFLLDKGILDEIFRMTTINTLNEKLDFKLMQEYFINRELIDEEYNKVISHRVVFTIGKKDEETNKIKERLAYNKYIAKNRGM